MNEENKHKSEISRLQKLVKGIENRLNEVETIAKLGHWELDLIKNELSWSDEVYRILDLKPGYLKPVYETYMDFVHPEDKKEVDKKYRRSIKNKEPFNNNHRVLLKNGSVKYLNVRCISEFDSNGKGIRSIGTIQDISEHIEFEKELKESQYFLEESQRVAQLGYYILDIKNNLWTSSKLLDEIFGIDDHYKRDIEGWIKLLHPEHIDEMVNYFQVDVLKKHNKFDREYRIINLQTNETKWVHGQGELEYNNDKEAIRMIGTIQDITKRKYAENELLKTNAKLIAMIDNTDDFIMIANEQGFPVMFNASYKKIIEQLLGVEPKPGVKPHTLLNDEQQNQFWDGLHERVLSGEKFKQEFEFPVDNKIRYFEFSFYPIIEKDKVMGFVEHSRDITDLKENEKMLLEAKEKAEESDRLKSAFLANMSHEIRTPMNGIIGFSEMIKKPKLTNEQRQQYADIIIENSYQLLDIVNDILDISIIETGQIKVKKDNFSVNEMLSDIYMFFEPNAINSKLKFVIKEGLQKNQDTIYTDKLRIKQIINNLIGNALKFTYQGSIEFGYIKKGDFMQFYVKDTGVGIKPELQNKIFERFSQLENQMTNYKGGTGLGLAISQGLVELLGGNIWCVSTEGKGSVFYFTIPHSVKN